MWYYISGEVTGEIWNWSLNVLARPKRPGAAPCRFFSALSFSESPLVSSGFYQRYFELDVAESVQLRRKVARFSCITLLLASDIAAILDLRHRFRHANGFEGMSFLQLFTWKVVRGFMNINKIQWILIYANYAPCRFSILAGTLSLFGVNGVTAH